MPGIALALYGADGSRNSTVALQKPVKEPVPRGCGMNTEMSEQIETWKGAGSKAVKVRIDASGRRLVGYVDLAVGEDRISDRLNNTDPFLFVRSDETSGDMERHWAIHKDAVSYVVALEEPSRPGALRNRGKFHRVTIELIRPATTVLAELFVPHGSTAEAVLNDSQRFINLRNVSLGDGPEVYQYLALARNQSRFWEVVLDEEK